MAIMTINKNNFNQEVLASDRPVLIDFWAPWCGPCRMFSPVIEEISEENNGTLKVGKINIDEEPELAQQFGIMSIPTIVLMKNGKAVASSVGMQSKSAVEKMIK